MDHNFASALHTPAINTRQNYHVSASGVWQCFSNEFSQKISHTPVSVVDVFAIGAGNDAKVYLEFTNAAGEESLTGLPLASILDNQSPLASLLEGLGITIDSERVDEFRAYLHTGIDTAKKFDPDMYQYSQQRHSAAGHVFSGAQDD